MNRLWPALALSLGLVTAACGGVDQPTRPTTTVEHPTSPPSAPVAGAEQPGTTVLNSADNHSFGSYHVGAYYWGGVKQSDYRYIWVFDRTSDPVSKAGLQQYINAHNSLFGTWPGLPYYLYYNDSANAGACFGDGTAGHLPGNSIILTCNGSPTGSFGKAWWSVGAGGHLVGEANVWLQGGVDQGYAYTGWCHELGHVIQFPGHATEKASCMYSPLNLSDPTDKYKGYTQNDLNEMLGNYYSHSIGGNS